MSEPTGVRRAPQPFVRVVVSWDPAVTFDPDSDEHGIVAVGLGADDHAYVLDDLSLRCPPEQAARIVISAYYKYSADRVVAEINQGGQLVETTLRAIDPNIPFRAVHASRGKIARAEPVSALYEQGRVHHCGVFAALEDQMTSYDGSRDGLSPDRLDALVWAIHELMLGEPAGGFIATSTLLVPTTQEDQGLARVPIEMPKYLDSVVAYAAGAVGPDPQALGVVFFGISLRHEDTPPLTVLDWDIRAVGDQSYDTWFGEVFTRLANFARITRAHPEALGIVFEPEGIGEVLAEQGYDIGFPYNTATLATSSREKAALRVCDMSIPQRVVAAGGYLRAGQVKLVREAHEKFLTYRGVLQSHLLQQLAAFGVGHAPADAGVLLAAFADGVTQLMSYPTMRQRASWERGSRPVPPMPPPPLPPGVSHDPESGAAPMRPTNARDIAELEREEP